MNLVIIILGIMYLMGFKVGTGLAICAIIEGILITVVEVVKQYRKNKEI